MVYYIFIKYISKLSMKNSDQPLNQYIENVGNVMKNAFKQNGEGNVQLTEQAYEF